LNVLRKRYRKLGELVDAPLSRGERAAKRRKRSEKKHSSLEVDCGYSPSLVVQTSGG